MAGEPVRPLLFLPPGTTPTTAAILIVQILECKRLSCKSQLSKDILQYALKILLCEDDCSLYPDSRSQSINGMLQTQQCVNVAMQTDDSNQSHASVQTEKCRIKLQKTGYKYSAGSYDVSTQVAFNDFSHRKIEDSEETEIHIESPTETSRKRQTFNCNEIVPYIAQPRKKRRTSNHIFPALNFHGKHLIDENKNKPPLIIPLVAASDTEVYDPRSFNSAISNKSEGSSHLPWRAQAICNCSSSKQQRYCNKKLNIDEVPLMDDELHINVLNGAVESSVIPSTSVRPNELNTNGGSCHQDVSCVYSQSMSKVSLARTAEEITAEDYNFLNNCKEHNDYHLADCLCNLAPREACVSDPRIKLICADVFDDIRTNAKRHSDCSTNGPLHCKKTKLEQCLHQVSDMPSTKEQLGCLTPNESPVHNPETPTGTTSFSPETFPGQNNLVERLFSEKDFTESCTSGNSVNIESHVLAPNPKEVKDTFKEISSINNDSGLFNVRSSKAYKNHYKDYDEESKKVKIEKEICELTKDRNITQELNVSAISLCFSPKNKIDGNTDTIPAENVEKLTMKNTDSCVKEESFATSNQNIGISELPSKEKKNASPSENSRNHHSSSLGNSTFEHQNYSKNDPQKNRHLEIENKDNCESLMTHSYEDNERECATPLPPDKLPVLNSYICEPLITSISERQKNCTKIRKNKDVKLLPKSEEISLQKLSVHCENDLNCESHLLNVPPHHSTDSINTKALDKSQHSEKLPAHHENNLSFQSDIQNITSYPTPKNKDETYLDKKSQIDSKTVNNPVSSKPGIYFNTKKKQNTNNSQYNEGKMSAEDFYSPTDELSIDSDYDIASSIGCSTLLSPDKSPALDLDENGNSKKAEEKVNCRKPYQKIIAAVPSFMPKRCTSLPSIGKQHTIIAEKTDKIPKSSFMTNQDSPSAPVYTTNELRSTAMVPLYTARRQTENEMTQTEAEGKDCSSWFSPQPFQNYYKWCEQGNEFTPIHYQSYYPPYTNNYPSVTSNWMYYHWWNGNAGGWNQLW